MKLANDIRTLGTLVMHKYSKIQENISESTSFYPDTIFDERNILSIRIRVIEVRLYMHSKILLKYPIAVTPEKNLHL